MKFFNIDCHISVISDIKNIFENLGHQVDHWSISGHRWVFNFPACQSPVINESNWKNINEEMVEKFYVTHKFELDKYDAFICCYPPIFLKLFEKFNKPIIVIAATRYDYPVIDDAQRLNWLEDSLNNNKNLILVANNEFDKKYCELFLKREWFHIPSLCEYTKEKHVDLKNEFVIFSKFLVNSPHKHQVNLGKYTWKDLFSHKGIIHFPYNVSTMSIFEQYSAGVPLYFPSIKFALELLNQNIPLFSEIVFPNKNSNKQPKQFLNEKWLSHSDFYNGIVECNYFDSYDEFLKIATGKFKKNSTAMNKDFIYQKWTNLLQKLI